MVASPSPEAGQPRYFAVSAPKFVVMSLASFGIYGLYWLYQNWVLERRHTGEDLSPLWRTFFSVIWIYSLLRRIRDTAGAAQVLPIWTASVTAAAYVLLNCALFLPDPYWLGSLLVVVPLVPVQLTVNRLNALLSPETPKNDSYSGKNLVLIVVGVIFYIIVILGMMVPVENESFTQWELA